MSIVLDVQLALVLPAKDRLLKNMLSIIVPSEFDEESYYQKELVNNTSSLQNVELIFVDRKEAKSRAQRINIGVHRAKGNIILLNHPRSLLEKEALIELVEMSKIQSLEWGGFIHKFPIRHPLLRFTSWYSNQIRAKLRGILYLDHCIYFHRDLWRRDLPDIEIFEDTVLSQYLKQHSAPRLLPYISETSAVRFETNGVFKQIMLNLFMKVCFHMNIDHKKMNRIYERNIKLN